MPNGRFSAILSAVVAAISLGVFLGLVRVESPVALAALVLSVVTVGMFEGSFASLAVDGDRVDVARGLLRLRGRQRLSVAHGFRVRVVVDRARRAGKNGGVVHLVELATDDASWVVAEERDPAVADRIASWLREKLPSERLRVEPSGSPEDEPPTSAAPEEQTRSQGDA